MSTSAIAGSSLNQLIHQYFQSRHGDLNQLGQALSSGDLAGAQTAYNKIVSLGQKGPFQGGDPFVVKQREQDFTAIGQALQSGDLAGAQMAYNTLESTLTKAGPRFDPVPPTAGSSNTSSNSSSNIASGPEIVLNLSNSSSGSSPEQININIANSANGGEQVSLSVGNQGSSQQQFSINLPANSNEQIVLNLLGTSPSRSSTSSTTTSPFSGGLSVTA